MEKTVSHRFGESTYETTPLEDFVDELASTWGVELGETRPTQSFSYGPFLERKGSQDGDVELSIWYTRNPSDEAVEQIRGLRNSDQYMVEVSPILFDDAEPRSEFAHLKKGDKWLVMEFGADGKRRVGVLFNEVADALTETNRQATVYGIKPLDDSMLKLDFRATAHRETRDELNTQGDAENAFNFVRNYMG